MTEQHEYEAFISRFLAIRKSYRDGRRAPHKPLLVLLALAKLQAGGPRLLCFSEIEGALRELLQRFDRPQRSGAVQAELPFWHLQAPGIWEFEDPGRVAEIASKRARGRPTRKDLEEHDVAAGFPAEVFDALSNDRALRQELAARLLEDNFPPSLHEPILDSIGFQWEVVPERVCTSRLKRNPAFRSSVLDAYEYKCAVCGFDARLANVPLAIEAAHIRWHSHEGPDSIDNGLALCSLHHRALDAGGLGLDEEHCVRVSPALSGAKEVERTLLYFAGKELRPPAGTNPSPAAAHIAWHSREVFRNEAPREEVC